MIVLLIVLLLNWLYFMEDVYEATTLILQFCGLMADETIKLIFADVFIYVS